MIFLSLIPRTASCVYDCDNDVCDSQMVNIQFQGGAVANLTMTAFSEAICKRHTRITGSKVNISNNYHSLHLQGKILITPKLT